MPISDHTGPISDLPKSLSFTAYDVTDLASLAPYFVDSSDRCGIYVLRFADGTAYAGKAGNVVNRFSDHRRDWAKKLPGVPIAQVEFASCPADQLDAAELAVIRQLERTDHLHNKLLTNRPGGHGDIEITRNGEQALRIPVDRAQRPRLSKAPVSDKLRRFVSFSMEPDAEQITDFAAVYLAESMPSPAETAGSMWTCTALPGTNGGNRLFTLNTGSLETLYSFDTVDPSGSLRTWVVMNVAIPEGRDAADLNVTTSVCEATVGRYRSEEVWTWKFDLGKFFDSSDGVISEILDHHLSYEDELFDLAFQLNRRLMARRPSMWIASHNEYLAAHFLAAAMTADFVETAETVQAGEG